MTIITSLALFQALLAAAATYSKWHSYLAKATDTHGNNATGTLIYLICPRAIRMTSLLTLDGSGTYSTGDVIDGNINVVFKAVP